MAALASAPPVFEEGEELSLVQGKTFHRRWGEIMGDSNRETDERKKILADLWDELVLEMGRKRVEQALNLWGDPHAFLRRFLVARSWDKERAFAQAKAAIEWREKTNASTLLVSLSLSRAHVQRMRTAYGSGPIGFDRCGHVTCLNRIGMANFNELLEINEAAGNAEEGQFCAGMDTSSFTRMSCHVQEYMAQRVFREATSAAEGYARTRMTVITDLKGLSFLKVMGQLPSIISVIKEISVVMQGYYPECLSRHLIINSPSLFSGIWKTVKGFLDPGTAAKFSVLSAGEQQDQVLEEVVGELADTIDNLTNEKMKDLPLIRQFDEEMGLL